MQGSSSFVLGLASSPQDLQLKVKAKSDIGKI
jgi:hypothetical protein